MREDSSRWRQSAACRGHDPDLFFPVSEAGPSLQQVRQARQVCRRCPVQLACLAWALEHSVSDGVWGGITAGERRQLPGRGQGAPLVPRQRRAVLGTGRGRRANQQGGNP
jgi:WhiB family transcriptional regulator, redox-sensing transcriptional regulator